MKKERKRSLWFEIRGKKERKRDYSDQGLKIMDM